ncbi:MAG TPA: glycosyltransferase [Candidatus Krumholzibacteria bacterium]|nr:glycosyltransferase [Candidatus Krumholzibacteria bacterium]
MLHDIALALSWLFLAYFIAYHSFNFLLILLAFADVRRGLWLRALDAPDLLLKSPYTPPLSILVPAYNEAVTIGASLRSLMALRLPRFEIIVVNDGSKDKTIDVLQESLKLRRRDFPYRPGIATARVRGLYEATIELPPAVERLIVVDKENGGKADALNAGINASACPYVISMDADSLIDDVALLQIFRVLLERRDVAAVGGQVAVANGCKIQHGKILKVGLPKSKLARFQIIEYVRSFTAARTALSRMNALLIVSGVFCIFEKELLIRIGGYLTEHLKSRLVHEYAGRGSSTVCEDMEIVVRLHRYIQEKGLGKVILSLPYPICWTEVPESASDLSKQRGRWFRGFVEILVYHRHMLFNPRYGKVGLLGWPSLVLFDFLGLFIEAFGYLSLPVFAALKILSYKYLLLFLAIAFGYGALVSVMAILLAFWSEPAAPGQIQGKPLLASLTGRELATLLVYCLFENIGYRQMTIRWRFKGLIDYLRGKKSWEKFDRIGFSEQPATPGPVPAAPATS